MMPDFAERLVRAGDATQARGDLLHVLYCIVMTVPQERLASFCSEMAYFRTKTIL
jgi:hypothetical protein